MVPVAVEVEDSEGVERGFLGYWDWRIGRRFRRWLGRWGLGFRPGPGNWWVGSLLVLVGAASAVL